MDLTVAAIPLYFGSMGAEHLYLKRQAAERGPSAGDYERRDTLASLAMGVGSLIAPLALGKVLAPVTPGRGRYGRVLVGTALGAAVATTVADAVARARGGLVAGVIPLGPDPDPDRSTAPGDPAGAAAPGGRPHPDPDAGPTSASGGTADPDAGLGRAARRRSGSRGARRVAAMGGVTALAAGLTAGATTWASRTAARRLWSRSRRDLGTGALAVGAAVLAWDFVYYWNHRLMHESRYMWAIHVVHHSSERYNLSTALRQPVADAFGTFVPTGLLALAGFRPGVIETARGVNLVYQFWIHTEAIGKLGPAEEILNTPSHHRVHHGSNRRYLDRNHGSILICWDRLFGTFAREEEPVVYGLTKNIHTFNPLRIATHEYAALFRDVARATTWRDRLGHLLRGPGWRAAGAPAAAP